MIIRIFLADDHAIVRDGIQFFLNSQPDMRVVGTTGDGREAVKQVAKLRPDVAIMGVTMPGLNGIDATEQIHERNPSTRVVILSMHSDMAHVVRALKAGASGYVIKESRIEELISAVRTVHGGGRHLSESIEEKLIDEYILHGSHVAKGDPFSKLSPREKEVFAFVLEGRTSREIGYALGLSQKTVNTYRCRLMEKLSVPDALGLVRFGIENSPGIDA